MGDEKRKLRSTSLNKENKMNNKKQYCEKKKSDRPKQNTSKDKNDNTKKVKTGNKNSCVEENNEDFISKTSFKNIVNVYTDLQRGICNPSTLKKVADEYYKRNLEWFCTDSHYSTEDLRVTALQWHPSRTDVFVMGGKGGSLNLYSVKEKQFKYTLSALSTSFAGIGPGGTIEEIRYNTKKAGVEVVTASVDGTVSSLNFETGTRVPLVTSSEPLVIWFCSLDVHKNGKSIYAGDNKGSLYIHQLDNNKTDIINKLHTSKIKHVEFNPRDPNLMVTASLDKKVKLWDLRKLKQKDDYVDCLQQDFSIISATFSKSDGCRLLTTDTLGELRVYKAPGWTLEHKIQHPHRVFQHLTAIRASWHPRADLFVIGRYPDPARPQDDLDCRSVDVYSATTGRLVHQLLDTSKMLKSISEFNCTGTMLATTSGSKVLLWKLKKEILCCSY